MKHRYERWIQNFRNKNMNVVQGMCLEASYAMHKKFPELTVVRGHVKLWDEFDESIYKYPHWWLIAEDGDIVDPTESQFPNLLEYEQWDESLTEPTGKCPNCGNYCFDHKQLCCAECEKEYISYLKYG